MSNCKEDSYMTTPLSLIASTSVLSTSMMMAKYIGCLQIRSLLRERRYTSLMLQCMRTRKKSLTSTKANLMWKIIWQHLLNLVHGFDSGTGIGKSATKTIRIADSGSPLTVRITSNSKGLATPTRPAPKTLSGPLVIHTKKPRVW